jgi:hypothetical protein
VGTPAFLDPVQELEAEAELGVVFNDEGSVAAATSSP